MRPQRQMPNHFRRYDNDQRAKTFDTFEGGHMVTGVKVQTRPVRLWLTSARDGALATLTITPRADGGYDLQLDADQSKTFDLLGLPFETTVVGVTRRAAAAPSFEGAAPKALDPSILAAEETQPSACHWPACRIEAEHYHCRGCGSVEHAAEQCDTRG